MTLHTEQQLPDTLIPIYVNFFNNSKKMFVIIKIWSLDSE